MRERPNRPARSGVNPGGGQKIINMGGAAEEVDEDNKSQGTTKNERLGGRNGRPGVRRPESKPSRQ